MQNRPTRHPRSSTVHPRSSTPHSRRAGFSFAEVMFAVVILGIGFILVAAIFPVAIQQTQSTSEEGSASIAAREAANAVTSVPQTVVNGLYSSTYANTTYNPLVPNPSLDYQAVQYEKVFPPTVKNYALGNTAAVPLSPMLIPAAPPAIVDPFVGLRWDAIKGNLISASDPRYAYILFYRRENKAAAAQLIVVAVSNRQRPIYDAASDLFPGLYQAASVSISTTPAVIPSVAVPTNTTIYTDQISIASGYPAEGFYVRTNGGNPLGTPYAAPWNRTYRLGRQLQGSAYGPGTFEIDAGDNTVLTAGTGGWGTAGGISDPPIASGTQDYLYPTNTLQPSVAYATLQMPAGSIAGQINLFAGPGGLASDNLAPPNAAPGAFVIIADDYPCDPSNQRSGTYVLPPNLLLPPASPGLPPTVSYTVGALNGRIFRLGQPVTVDASGTPLTTSGVYNLDPAYGMRPITPGGIAYSPDMLPNPDYLNKESPAIAGASNLRAKVFIIGMGRDNTGRELGTPNTSIGPQFSKGSQDVGIYSTFFQVQ